MILTGPYRVRCLEDNAFQILARVKIHDRTVGARSDFTGFTVKTFDIDNGNAPLDTVELTPEECVFDTLQTDWDVDSTGYNFLAALSGSLLSQKRRVRLEILVDPAVGEIFYFPPIIIDVQEMLSS